MPSPYVKKLAKEFGKSEKEIEALWKQAKVITSDTFGKTEDDFSTKEYKYTVGIIKNMLEETERALDPMEFLESNLSVSEFLETLGSSSFDIGNVIPPKKKQDDKEKVVVVTRKEKERNVAREAEQLEKNNN